MFKFVFLICLVIISKNLFAETVYLTSLSWPPYSDKALNEQGASIAVAKAAFKAQGHTLVVDFFPWSRAINLAKESNSKYVGYFPEYYFETNEFSFSQPMGSSPLALIQHIDKPINFNSLHDLKGLKLGVVQDYINTPELDNMIANGEIDAKPVQLDSRNIKKVATSRVDLAVIDVNVFKFLIKTDNSLKPFANKVELNKKILADKKLYIAFRANAEGQRWQKIYDAGLKKIDADTLTSMYLDTYHY